MKNVLKIIGLILLVAGAVVANFSTVAIVDGISIAVSAVGLALTIVGVWGKTEKKTWRELVSIICFAVGGFCCGIAGITDTVVTTLITSVSGVVLLIVGLLTGLLKKKDA